ncbi:MAG: hypothetical protein PHH04_05640 [Thomasclavelia sp.]|nr:hypothetical protein [Thomasclavelia sp.]
MFNTLDLHGMNVSEAKIELDHRIASIKEGELTVIHGYSSNTLQQFVRKKYHHKKVVRKILTMNPGETILVIK